MADDVGPTSAGGTVPGDASIVARNGLDGTHGRADTVPSTLRGPAPSPTRSFPDASTFAIWAAFVGSTTLTALPVALTAAYEAPPAASSSAMQAMTRAGLGRGSRMGRPPRALDLLCEIYSTH